MVATSQQMANKSCDEGVETRRGTPREGVLERCFHQTVNRKLTKMLNTRTRVALRFVAVALICGSSALASNTIAATLSDYRLSTGDVIEITAVGAPELQRKAPVELTGDVVLPLVGRVQAAGMTVARFENKLRDLMRSQVFRRRTPDGREFPVVLSIEEISVSIAEYRPIYINGDVAKPGEHRFRPGVTIRQALALSGGYDVMRFRAKDPFLEAADLQSEYASLWTDFAKEQVHVQRLQAELSNDDKLDLGSVIDTPVSPSVLAQIEKMAVAQLSARNTNHKNQRDHLLDAIRQEEQRIGHLTGQREKEQEAADADAAEYLRTKQTVQRGVAPNTRLLEARRVYLSSGAQVLQTSAMIAQIERERQQFGLQLSGLEDRRRVELLAELEAAQVKLAMLRLRLQSVGEKLVYTGVVRTQLVRGKGGAPDLMVFRKHEDGDRGFVADEDTELLPGDVVEVSVRSEAPPVPQQQAPRVGDSLIPGVPDIPSFARDRTGPTMGSSR